MYEDNYQHKGLRKRLIEILRDKKISDEKILGVMAEIPRHWYIPGMNSALWKHAYDDKAFQIGAGQTISQPYTVAFQTQLLEVKKGDKILEIGTGSGYQTTVLKKMGAKVFSIERQLLLHKTTKAFLEKINIKAKLFYGDGYKGLPTFAPFDKILITCGAPDIPNTLIKQLKVGGILVIPEGEGKVQTMKKLIKTDADNNFDMQEFGEFSFVPMLEDKSR